MIEAHETFASKGLFRRCMSRILTTQSNDSHRDVAVLALLNLR